MIMVILMILVILMISEMFMTQTMSDTYKFDSDSVFIGFDDLTPDQQDSTLELWTHPSSCLLPQNSSTSLKMRSSPISKFWWWIKFRYNLQVIISNFWLNLICVKLVVWVLACIAWVAWFCFGRKGWFELQEFFEFHELHEFHGLYDFCKSCKFIELREFHEFKKVASCEKLCVLSLLHWVFWKMNIITISDGLCFRCGTTEADFIDKVTSSGKGAKNINVILGDQFQTERHESRNKL